MYKDSYLINQFTNVNMKILEPPKYLLGDNWYDILRSKMSILGWTQQPSMEDILREFRKVEYEKRYHYLKYEYRTVKAFVKEVTVYGWSNSGQVALTLYRIKLHSENSPEYICWA